MTIPSVSIGKKDTAVFLTLREITLHADTTLRGHDSRRRLSAGVRCHGDLRIAHAPAPQIDWKKTTLAESLDLIGVELVHGQAACTDHGIQRRGIRARSQLGDFTATVITRLD